MEGTRERILTGLCAVMMLPQGRPSIEILGFHLVESQGQKRSLEIESQRARVYKAEELTALDAVRSLVWGQGLKPFRVTGDSAVVHSVSQDLEIYPNAQVVSPDGFIFKTASVLYKASDRLILGEENVEATQVGSKRDADIKLTGKGLTIHLAKNTYEIRRNVRADQKLSANKPLSIVSQNLVIHPDSGSAVFTRKVSVKSPDFALKGDRLTVHFEKKSEDAPYTARRLVMGGLKPDAKDRIEAEMKAMKIRSRGLVIDLDPDHGSLTKSEAVGEAEAVTDEGVSMRADTLITDTEDGRNRVTMKGNVTILTQKRKGQCEEATFYPDTGDIILNRIASVTNDTQTLEGERIRFSTKSADVFVEKARGTMERKDLGGR